MIWNIPNQIIPDLQFLKYSLLSVFGFQVCVISLGILQINSFYPSEIDLKVALHNVYAETIFKLVSQNLAYYKTGCFPDVSSDHPPTGNPYISQSIGPTRQSIECNRM